MVGAVLVAVLRDDVSVGSFIMSEKTGAHVMVNSFSCSLDVSEPEFELAGSDEAGSLEWT